MKTCYYELLGVEINATDVEIKKSYRKKALLLHPDKNPHDVEGANARFSLIRSAYEVLSDPQERSWYDSHKSEILREDDDYDTPASDTSSTVIPNLSVQELLRYFNPELYTRMDDSQAGFYHVVNLLFDRLASEEVKFGKYQNLQGYSKYMDDSPNSSAMDQSVLMYPRFGNSMSDYETSIRVFYNTWASFLTVKPFSWMDEYRYSMAPDRRTRRLMEKENKKLRDAEKKNFNETVRRFVGFVKKRDPRVKKGVEVMEARRKRQQEEALQRQAKEHKIQQMAEQAKHEIQDWQKMDLDELEEIERQLREEFSSADDSTDSEFDDFGEANDTAVLECVVCDKTFKSQKQLDIHEKSKKHERMLEQLRQEMIQEGIDLGFDSADTSDFDTATSGGERSDDDEKDLSSIDILEHAQEDEISGGNESIGEQQPVDPLKLASFLDVEVDDEISENDISTGRPEPALEPPQFSEAKPFRSKTANNLDEELARLVHDATLDLDDDWGSKPKKGKKKKKSSAEKPNNKPNPDAAECTIQNGPTETCAVCSESFPSRNKLFQHVEKTGHAAPPPRGKKGKKKR